MTSSASKDLTSYYRLPGHQVFGTRLLGGDTDIQSEAFGEAERLRPMPHPAALGGVPVKPCCF